MAKTPKTTESQDTAPETAQTEGSPQKNKTGRPSSYNPETAQKICEMLSEGIPLREICRMDGFPAWRTIYDWMYKDDALGDEGVGLSASIARAREVGYDSLAEECLSIADDANNDWMQRTDKDGRSTGWVLNGEHVQRSKLRIETRLKLLAKFNPKKYGERVQLANDEQNPIDLGNSLFGSLLKNVELKLQAKLNEADDNRA